MRAWKIFDQVLHLRFVDAKRQPIYLFANGSISHHFTLAFRTWLICPIIYWQSNPTASEKIKEVVENMRARERSLVTLRTCVSANAKSNRPVASRVIRVDAPLPPLSKHGPFAQLSPRNQILRPREKIKKKKKVVKTMRARGYEMIDFCGEFRQALRWDKWVDFFLNPHNFSRSTWLEVADFDSTAPPQK